MKAALDRAMLDRAALLALRAAGYAEPNPLVGCVIGRADGSLLGIGHHHRFGEAHAEVQALRDCARRGADPRGATAWVTLEPCNHTGKTGPCARALIDAGVAQVVYARADPHALASGGAAALRAAGVNARLSGASVLAQRISDPFIRRVTTGLPWIIAKWAQTIDGRIATSAGESKWISGPTSRRQVHRLRARVDAILTGIGTVLADDPLLTVRGVCARRTPLRILVDPKLQLPIESALVRSVGQAPLLVVAGAELVHAGTPRVHALRAAGVEVVGIERSDRGLELASFFRDLAAQREVVNILVEAGPRMLGRLFGADLVDEARVYVAPTVLGDPAAPGPASIGHAPSLSAAARMTLLRASRVGADALLVYRRTIEAITCPPAPLPAR
jgi:diaminohydroxyphosphoribosylaminopyrimidine deaminase/5-amino-6-(5-phosphoribosylamino)uracil reductase